MIKKIAIFTPLLALGLAACLEDPTVGRGGITLSPQAQQGFEAYKQVRSPGHFAVSRDGQAYYYNHCPDGRCRRGYKLDVIQKCESYSRGSPCKIYGSRGEVVWQDAEPADS